MIYKQFFSELGKLLYAVADVDGSITQKEKKTLRELVAKELLSLVNKKDEHGTDVGFFISFHPSIGGAPLTSPFDPRDTVEYTP